MSPWKSKVREAAAFITAQMETPPQIALLTGTGLGDSTRSIRITKTVDYAQIPHYPQSTVESHAGNLGLGTLAGKEILVFSGRCHLYEGYSPQAVTFSIRIMQELGVGCLILSNASGGLNTDFEAGDIMVIADHINLTGENPLVGPNEDSWGLRFPDMVKAYDRDLARIASDAAGRAGFSLREGVYVGLKGPSLETPAEMRFLRRIGADAVGFSTVMETIAAVHGGLRVLGLSTITNINDPDDPAPATMEAILAVAQKTAPRLDAIIRGVIEAL
jgi:purine-nucleoside phosphorylase